MTVDALRNDEPENEACWRSAATASVPNGVVREDVAHAGDSILSAVDLFLRRARDVIPAQTEDQCGGGAARLLDNNSSGSRPPPPLIASSQSAAPTRTPSEGASAGSVVHATEQQPENASNFRRNAAKWTALLRFRYAVVYVASLGPPIVGLLGAFIIGYLFNYHQLFHYKWNCKMYVFLPSISRVINMRAERIFWHMAVFVHLPFRPIIIFQNFFNCRKRLARSTSRSFRYRLDVLLAYAMTTAACAEVAFLVALTVVGERESPSAHVATFVGFLLSSCAHFTLLSYLTKPLRKDGGGYNNVNLRLVSELALASDSFAQKKDVVEETRSSVFRSPSPAFTMRVTPPHSALSRTLTSTSSDNFCTRSDKNRYALWFTDRLPRIDQRTARIRITIGVFLMAVVVTVAFSLNVFYCVKHSYTVFAGAEYITVAVILLFHSTSILDLNRSHYVVTKPRLGCSSA